MAGLSLGLKEPEYRPSEDEPFMNERQLEYFRHRLLDWKDAILRETRETVSHLQSDTENHPDLADRASSETDRALELRTRDRQRKLIAKIDEALRRIDARAYGFCEETGEPIGLARLEARPIATLGLEAQERHERRERVHRDDQGPPARLDGREGVVTRFISFRRWPRIPPCPAAARPAPPIAWWSLPCRPIPRWETSRATRPSPGI